MTDQELKQLFANNSDCYADTHKVAADNTFVEGDVIQAMTAERFVKVLRKHILLPDRPTRGDGSPF